MKTTTTEQNNSNAGIDTQSVHEVQEGVMQAVLGIMVVAAALVGVWGIISLFGGIAEGGIMGLINGWLTSLSGM